MSTPSQFWEACFSDVRNTRSPFTVCRGPELTVSVVSTGCSKGQQPTNPLVYVPSWICVLTGGRHQKKASKQTDNYCCHGEGGAWWNASWEVAFAFRPRFPWRGTECANIVTGLVVDPLHLGKDTIRRGQRILWGANQEGKQWGWSDRALRVALVWPHCKAGSQC